MEPILSIITPIYNSFSLLSKSIEVFNRWNNNQIEWVIVDDCSTDNTFQLLLDYRDRNPNLNISIYSCDVNSGPGVARNIGIQKSKGNYVTFLDSDDFFDDSFWPVISPELNNNHDCIIFDASFYYNDGSKKEWPLFRNGQSEGRVQTKDAIVYLIGGPWGKIYKKNVLIENNVVFLPQKRREDMPFTKHAVSCCKDIIYLKKCIYMYVQHDNSLIRDSSLVDIKNTVSAFNYIRKNLGNTFPTEVEALFISTYLYSVALLLCNTIPKKEYIKRLYESEQIFPNYYLNPYFKNSTIQERLVIMCVRYKLYYGIKMLLWIKRLRDKCLYRTY